MNTFSKLFKTIGFFCTSLLLLNSCEKNDSKNENESGAAIDPNKVEMIKVEGGTFILHEHQENNNTVRYQVTLSDFFIGKYEITQSQWNVIKNSDYFYGIRIHNEKTGRVNYGETKFKDNKIRGLWRSDLISQKGKEIQEINESTLSDSQKETEKQKIEEKYAGVLSNLSPFQGENLPAVDVTWNDAARFCNALSRKEGREECYQIYFHYDSLKTEEKDKNGEVIKRDTFITEVLDSIVLLAGRKGYRLPTEAEWVFAAKGGNKSNGTAYAGGDDPDQVAWYSENSSGQLHIVGAKRANELGIFDMSGNAHEWCNDWYIPYTTDANTTFEWFADYDASKSLNPVGPSENYIDKRGAKVTLTEHTIRGGNWAVGENLSKIGNRSSKKTDFWNYTLGFRVAHP